MKSLKGILAFLLAIALISLPVSSALAQNGERAVKKESPSVGEKRESLADQNRNKLSDSLDAKLQVSGEEESLPVIVLFKDDSSSLENWEKNLAKDKIRQKYTHIPGFAANLTKKEIESLQNAPEVVRIDYDETVYALLGSANDSFGISKARTDFGVDGNRDGLSTYSKDDIVIAVIDTGIDTNHVDLNGGKVIGWKDFVSGKTSPYDDNGHGTHVASIAAGEGEANSSYKGVAPGAALVGLKVLDRNGSGTMSNVTAAIDWAISNKAAYGIEVLNLSLGTSGSSDGTDTTSLAVNRAVDAGLTVVVAAGNSGPSQYTVGSPGAAEKAITVAAMGDLGENGFYLAGFSSRGYTADGRVKPDIAAPGVNITAAKAGTTNGYVTYSGTSMATPFTAGTVALMLDANPSLTPVSIKNLLGSTAIDWGPSGKDIDYGFGRLDGYQAIAQAGGWSGTGPAVPNHLYQSGSLASSGKSITYAMNVTSTSFPIAVTLILGGSQDFDLYLYDPSGALVGRSEGTTRQETIAFTPSKTGNYTIEVYSYSGSGTFFFDASYK
ncbi:S8 family serine peptidase [Thermicanus aegyptius]|uniref:S8 family serine peptidase n=1 Tax=Thermicanus aegyptius TaxID=94009 RepID=UPI000422DFCF|nr:S8 family serine peptidase [Thermicanus aegyptius]